MADAVHIKSYSAAHRVNQHGGDGAFDILHCANKLHFIPGVHITATVACNARKRIIGIRKTNGENGSVGSVRIFKIVKFISQRSAHGIVCGAVGKHHKNLLRSAGRRKLIQTGINTIVHMGSALRSQ